MNDDLMIRFTVVVNTILAAIVALVLYSYQQKKVRKHIAEMSVRQDCDDASFCKELTDSRNVPMALIYRDVLAAAVGLSSHKLYPHDRVCEFGEIDIDRLVDELEKRELPLNLVDMTPDPNRHEEKTVLQYIEMVLNERDHARK